MHVSRCSLCDTHVRSYCIACAMLLELAYHVSFAVEDFIALQSAELDPDRLVHFCSGSNPHS